MTQISSSAFNATQPMCFARGPNGDLYGVNGLDRGLRWDGVTANVEQLGISAPAAPPSVSANTSSPTYTVRAVDLTEGGKGYTQEPAVTVSNPPSGTPAKARATVANASVAEIIVTDFGNGYTSAPTVTIAAPTGSVMGSGATLTPVMGQFISGARITNAGSGYTSPPTVTVSDAVGEPGAGAILEAYVLGGKVRGVVVINPGTTAYTNPSISFSGGGGSSAAATPLTRKGVSSVTVTAGGSGYSGRFSVRFSTSGAFNTASPAVAFATANTSGAIASVEVTSPGVFLSNPSAVIGTPVRLLAKPAAATATLSPGIAGRFLCAYRYVDDTERRLSGPIPSSLSPIATLDVDSPASAISWSGLSAGSEARVSKIELWRTTADQAIVFYRVAVLPSTDTSFTDSLRDEDLSAPSRSLPCTGVASTDVLTCSGHGLAEGDEVSFSSLTGGAGLTVNTIYYARDVTGTTFKVSAARGGAAFNFTTDLSAGVANCRSFGALPVVLSDGSANAYRFRPPPANKSTVVIYQDRAWYAVDSPGREYNGTANANASEPNTLYFSEVDEPESVPEANQIILQDNVNGSDRITALMPFGGGMVVFQERNSYRLTYASEPLLDGSLSLIAQRGCLHQRAWDVHDGVAYVADYAGIYVSDGTQVTAISETIDDFWSSGRIKFSAATNMHLRVDPRTRIVRFFYEDSSETILNYPDRALCYHPLTKAWWVEIYGQPMSAACVAKTGSQLAVVAGAFSGALLRLDSGGSDVLVNGTTQGVPCSIRTGAMAINASKDRAMRLLYKPTTAQATLSLKLHYNNSSSPRPAAVATDRGSGFVTTGAQAATLDMRSDRSALGSANGIAICQYAGRVDDRSAGADRHLAVDLSITKPSSETVTLYGLGVAGVGE